MRLSIWFLYLILFPIQLLPQGGLQLADYILLIGIILMIVRIVSQQNSIYLNNVFLKGAFFFAIYSLTVSFIFYIVYSDFKFLLAPFNYLYCFLCLYFVADLSRKESFFKITYLSLIITLGIQLILFLKTGLNYDSGRCMIMFQNPNQLGFWGLIVILILVSINNNIFLKRPFLLYGAIILSSFFILVSISQAAIITLLLLLILLLFLFFRKRSVVLISTFLFISFFTFNHLDLYRFDKNLYSKAVITRFETDLLNDDDSDNNLEGRNYNRISENSVYLIFGAGESGLSRFGYNTNEIHSTFGSLIFSYGLIGFLIFMIPLLRISLLPFKINSVIFLIFLLVTLTHNVFRWTLFWVLPYLMFCVKKVDHVRN